MQNRPEKRWRPPPQNNRSYLAILPHLTISDTIVLYIITSFHLRYHTFGGISDFTRRRDVTHTPDHRYLSLARGHSQLHHSFLTPIYVGNNSVEDTLLDRSARIFFISSFRYSWRIPNLHLATASKLSHPAISIVLVRMQVTVNLGLKYLVHGWSRGVHR